MAATQTEAAAGGGAPAPDRRPHPIRRLYDWVLSWSESRYGTVALFGLSFAESSFFPIPPDVLQIALSISAPRRAFFYAAVSAVASVLGGLAGYAIGAAVGPPVHDFFVAHIPGFTEEAWQRVADAYQRNAFLAVFTAAFTPIPYKVFTIAGGVFGVSLPEFILGSALGRSGRFFAVGTLIFLFGPPVRRFIDRYFEVLTIAFTVLLVGAFLLVKWLT